MNKMNTTLKNISFRCEMAVSQQCVKKARKKIGKLEIGSYLDLLQVRTCPATCVTIRCHLMLRSDGVIQGHKLTQVVTIQEFIRKDRRKELLYYVNLIRACQKVLNQLVYRISLNNVLPYIMSSLEQYPPFSKNREDIKYIKFEILQIVSPSEEVKFSNVRGLYLRKQGMYIFCNGKHKFNLLR